MIRSDFLFNSLAVVLVVAASPVSVSGQSIGESAAYGDVRLEDGFVPDPHEIQLTAGGTVKVKATDDCNFGYVAEAPDLDFHYEADGNGTLFIYAASDEDTILLINHPDGEWSCDDDGWGGLDPLVVIPNAASGLYNIWVGRYGNKGGPATLNISELDPRVGSS